jgi:hypothetical protein
MPDSPLAGLLDALDGPAVDVRAPRGALRPVSGQ